MNYTIDFNLKEKVTIISRDWYIVIGLFTIALLSSFQFWNLWSKESGILHTGLELVCVFISLAAFFLFWFTYELSDFESKGILAFGFLLVAMFDLLHLLYYPALNILNISNYEQCVRFWILARLTEAIALLLTSLNVRNFIKGRIKELLFFLGITALLIASTYVFDGILPKFYTATKGVTPIKIFFDYIIITIDIITLYYLFKRINKRNTITYRCIFLGILFGIGSELNFTLYTNQQSFFTLFGHILKCIFYFYLYKGIFVSSITAPYENRMGILNESEERFKCAFDNLTLGVALTEMDGKIIRSNRFLEKLLGYSEGELVGVKFADIIPKEDNFINESYIKDLLNRNKERVLYYEGRYIHKSGEDVWVKVNISMTNSSAGAPVYFIYEVQDTTTSKKIIELETGMKKKAEQLKEAIEFDRLKTEFFANLSHELRTPLNVITGATQLLEIEINNHPIENATKNLYYIKQNSRRLLRLVNNLIDTTKIEAGFFQLNLKNYNIVSLVEDIAQSISVYTDLKGLKLVFDTDTEEKIIACDPDKIERILLNLLSNSIKFTESGGTIFVNVYAGNENVCISVKDTGVGIPFGKQDFIFDRFAQVDKSLVKNVEGSGIGLSLVKSLVELQGGSISLKSIPSFGSEFTVCLPSRTINSEDKEVAVTVDSDIIERINVEFSDIYFNN